MATCTGCDGTGECNVCKGSGKIGRNTSRGYEWTICTACEKMIKGERGNGVCRVCRGTRVNPPLR